MPRIAPLDPTQASPAIAEALFGVKTKLGGLPNIILTLAHSPTALHRYLGFRSQQAQGLLDARQREIVALAVGQANRCGYCLAAHTVIGRGRGPGRVPGPSKDWPATEWSPARGRSAPPIGTL